MRPRILTIIILFAGAVIRLVNYLGNRSLWLDEVALARNIIDRDVLGLLKPLAYDQGAPALFLILVKIVTLLFGHGELALRFVPFLASLGSIVLFGLIAVRLFDGWLAPVAAVVFAFSYPLVYYAQECKQYSTDVLAVLAVTYCALRVLDSGGRRTRQIVVLTIVGCVSLFLSHPAIFAIAGVSCVLLAHAITRRQGFTIVACVGPIAAWVICFGINYLAFLRGLASNQYLHDYWSAGFVHLSLKPAALVESLHVPTTFLYFLGFEGVWRFLVFGLLVFAAASAVWRRSVPALLFCSYVLFAVVASALGKYPIADRLALYLAPPLVLLALKGVEVIVDSRFRAAAPLVAGTLLIPMLISGAQLSMHRIEKEDERSVLAYVKAHRRPGEHVYVYYDMEHSLYYYWNVDARKDPTLHLGVDRTGRTQPDLFLADIAMMRPYGRVWFVYAHDIMGIERYMRAHMQGSVVDETRALGASAFEFEFAGANSKP